MLIWGNQDVCFPAVSGQPRSPAPSLTSALWLAPVLTSADHQMCSLDHVNTWICRPDLMSQLAVTLSIRGFHRTDKVESGPHKDPIVVLDRDTHGSGVGSFSLSESIVSGDEERAAFDIRGKLFGAFTLIQVEDDPPARAEFRFWFLPAGSGWFHSSSPSDLQRFCWCIQGQSDRPAFVIQLLLSCCVDRKLNQRQSN